MLHIRFVCVLYQANTTQKTKYLATRTPLNTGGELMCSGLVSCFCSTYKLSQQDYLSSIWLVIVCIFFSSGLDALCYCRVVQVLPNICCYSTRDSWDWTL